MRFDYRPVLQEYPADCQPMSVEFLASAGGFSGARLWRLSTPRGMLCLRRWPVEHPAPERLEFIQAVLWHVHQEGFVKAPLPLETRSYRGYVSHAGHLWEIAPWLPGRPDFCRAPTLPRLRTALATLAEFHQAAASFPLPEPPTTPSPGIGERRQQLAALVSSGFEALRCAMTGRDNPFRASALRILEFATRGAGNVQTALERALHAAVPLAPCMRDIWHENVLFDGETVTGLIDFGSLRAENVAADVARLLGSMAEDDPRRWREGLAAYESVRPLSSTEAQLVSVFDASGVLLGGINWLSWLYLEGRTFERPAAVQQRLDYFCRRLPRVMQGP